MFGLGFGQGVISLWLGLQPPDRTGSMILSMPLENLGLGNGKGSGFGNGLGQGSGWGKGFLGPPHRTLLKSSALSNFTLQKIIETTKKNKAIQIYFMPNLLSKR